MKKLLAVLIVTVSPIVALAAYNDVSLTTDAVIQVGSYTLNVAGSTATIESITVDSSNFTVTLASGSTIKITSPDLHRITPDNTSNVTAGVCTASESSITLSYSGAGSVTNIVTPSSTVCTDPTPSAPVVVTPPVSSSGRSSVRMAGTNPIARQTQSVSLAQSSPSTPTFVRNLSSGSTGSDVKSLQAFLNGHGFPVAQAGPGSAGNETDTFGEYTRQALARFQAANGISPAIGNFGPLTMSVVARMLNANTNVAANTSAPTQASESTFARNLSPGNAGSDVKALQQYLNTHGFPIAVSGPGSAGQETDSFGELTRSALIKFQKANGITPTGYFGPITRAFILNN